MSSEFLSCLKFIFRVSLPAMYRKSPIALRSVLYVETFHLLKNRPVTLKLPHIAQATGLPLGWLSSFLAHPQMSPSIDRVEALYRYLKNKPFPEPLGL